MMTVNPADLRFTQESIACHFKAPYEHFSIRDALKKIQTGQMSPDDFPRVSVISYEGCLWSTDNRRLWVFRKAKCPQITVKMTTMHPRLDKLISVRSRYSKLSKAEFLPRVRGSCQNGSPVPPVSRKGLHPRVAEVMSRYGFLERVQGSQNELPLPRVASRNLHGGVQGAMSRFKRPTLRPGLHSPNSLVITMDGSINTAGPRPESSNANAHMEPVLSSFSEASGGRHDHEVTRTRPAKDDIVCSLRDHTCTQARQSQLEKKTSAQIALLPASTHDGGRLTESWFGWVRNLIFGCFGCG